MPPMTPFIIYQEITFLQPMFSTFQPQVLLGIVSKTTMQGCGYNAQAPTFTTSNKDTDPAEYYDDIYLGCVCLDLG